MAIKGKGAPAPDGMSDDERIQILSAPSWVPGEAGDKITGVVMAVRKSTRTNDLGTTVYPLVTIKDEKGNMHGVHGIGKVLMDRFAELRVKRGDELTIVYKGRVQSKRGGSPYSDFAVISSAETIDEFDWSTMNDSGDELPF